MAARLLGVQGQGRLEGVLGVLLPASRPEELRQPDLGGHRLRVRRDSLPERRLGLLPSSFHELKPAEVRLPTRSRVKGDGLLDQRDAFVDVLEPRQGVPAKDQRIGILRVHAERLLRAGPGLVHPAGGEQQRARLQLRVSVVGQQVRRAHVLGERAAPVPVLEVEVAQFQTCGGELDVLLHRVPELQHGGGIVALLQQGVAALEVALGAPRAAGHRERATTVAPTTRRIQSWEFHGESRLQREG